MKKHYLLFLAFLLCTGLVFAGGQKEEEGRPPEGMEKTEKVQKDTIVVAVQNLPQAAMSAMAENSNVALRIDYSVEENLINTDYYDGFKQKPGLAESWELKDDTTLVFHLRKGVKFHNGEEMTAEDVAFTFGQERLMGEDAPARETAAPFLYNIKSVTVLDKYTVEVKARKKDALFITRFASFPSQIISKKGYKDAGSWEAFGKMPIGTGPYKVVEYTDDSRVVLERFEDYWGPEKGAAKKIIFKYVPELSTRIAGLRSGDFDIITEVPPDQAKAVDSMSGVKVVGGPIRNIYGMFFDETNTTPMQDPRVREALTLAVDRKKLVDTLFSGLTTIPDNWQMKLFGDMYIEGYPGVKYDPVKAKQLLKEAGYNGEKIVYRTQPGYYTLEQTVAEAVTQMWNDAGINVELQVKENWSQVLEENDEFNIINGSFTAYYPDPVGQFWRRFGVNSGYAQGRFWTNADEFNRLGGVLETSYDLQERRDAFKKMLDIFDKDPKGLYLYNLPMIYGVRDSVEWKPLPVEGMDFTTRALKNF